jgi:predicted amidohydrolase YtcJ
MSPANDDAAAAHFAGEHQSGALPQRIVLAGGLHLGDAGLDRAVQLGPVKLHLHEASLPDFDEAVGVIRAAHAKGRGVAVHCVTEAELVFALAALEDAGVRGGDRIEHASVASDALVQKIEALGLAVVMQPNFVAERGDAYMSDIPAAEWPHLVRLRAFRAADVALAGGSDAPFGGADPWAAMAAAVSRRTASGLVLGAQEMLTPEEALDLFLADPVDMRRTRIIAPGEVADLCLLDRSWAAARSNLSADLVRATIIGGRILHQRVDQSPIQSDFRANTFAR